MHFLKILDLKNEEYEFKSVQNLSVIPEENHRTRSHSVGQTVTKMNSKGRPDDARRILSQPLLTNGAFDTVYENKTLCKSHKNTSGTLSRLDIFYQVRIELNCLQNVWPVSFFFFIV